ncbi:MAG TPA: DUF2510 domain-containing protein [Trebonia sp.]|nr:DUF2510 domain-containing protein [Trebonia sp.]
MDLPPSGWYPDPYGVPGLLRWWDGSTWTQHTHADGPETTDTAEPATIEPSVRSTTAQPAIAATTVQPAIAATTVQPAVQPSTVQPTTVQPAVDPTRVQSPVQPPSGGDANGTQILFLGDDAWTTPGTPTGAAAGDRYGYYRTQRRRRMLVAGGLVGGTLVAFGVIALVVNNLGQSSTPTAAKSPARPAHTSAPPPSPTPSATPSATPPGSLLADGQSGMSYTQLPSPWQPTCPSGLNNQQFTWTAGESAIAGQVNGGQTTWYGVACSGPLPQQYGYNGVADLENTATNLVNTFNGTYYGTLQHNFQQEVSQPLQVSGHAGWEIKFLMSYTNIQGQGLSWNDELGAVVVADLGSGVAPAVFYTSIPGNLGESNVDSLVSSLTVNAPTQQPGGGGSPGDGGSPAVGGGSPAAGGGNGNGDGNNP